MWDAHNMTDLIRDLLRAVPPEAKYGTGRPFLMTYQIAIEFTRLNPVVAAALAHTTGGEGEGPYALTTYIARWLPDRITRGATDIEMRFLSPQDLINLQFNDGGTVRTATTNQAGWNSTMFRLVGTTP
jgi:hypothetical protein